LLVTTRPFAFSTPDYVEVAPGLTVLEVVRSIHAKAGVPEAWWNSALVMIDGEVIIPDRWPHLITTAGTNIVVSTSLNLGGGGDGGGKSPVRTLLTIVVVAVAAHYLSPLVGAKLGAMMGTAATATTAASTGYTIGYAVGSVVAAAAVSYAGMALINAIAPIRPSALSNNSAARDSSESPTYSINGGSNDLRRFGVIPVVLGIHKQVPPLGAMTYSEVLGNDEYLRMLVVWGYGPLKIENIKIGETLLTSYQGYEIETVEGRTGDPALTLFPSDVYQDQVGVRLTSALGWVQRTSQLDADELSVDIVFPQGLVLMDDAGLRTSITVAVELRYRKVGDAGWISITGQEINSVTRATSTTVRVGYRWQVDNGEQYEVAMQRTTPDSTSTRIMDEVTWTVLRTFQVGVPINFRQPLAMTALRIKATDQLSGAIANLSATVSSYANIWDGVDWDTEAVSNNPAALMRLVLMGPANERRRSEAQVDQDNLADFYNFCANNGYAFNMVRDFQSSVWETCADICAAGRASPSLSGGKWGVMMDEADKPIRQHFTPRNSWGFESSRMLTIKPHAWRVRFINEDQDFQQDERIVYDDGYSASNATHFEGLEFPGITDPDLVWKFGRFHIAQLGLRPEEYAFNCDLEHLACQRGDLILVSHDVPMWGLGWGRVKEVLSDGGVKVGVVLDERLVVESGKSYNLRFRLEDGTSYVRAVSADPGETDEFAFTETTTENIQVGDLSIFGEVGTETTRLIIKGVDRDVNYTAKLICVDEGPAIYTADSGTIPVFDSNISIGGDVTKFPPPPPLILSIQSGTSALTVIGSRLVSRVLVALAAGAGNVATDSFQVRYRLQSNEEWMYVGSSHVSESTLALWPVVDGSIYEVQARSLTAYGVVSNWTEVRVEQVVGQTERPPDVTSLAVNIVGAEAHISWSAVVVIDLSHYQVRWSPAISGATWNSAIDVDPHVSGTSTTLPAQVGTYLVKAVDLAGFKSETAAAAITTIAKLTGLNIIESITNENPTWLGEMEDTYYASEIAGVILLAAGDLYAADNLYDIGNLYLYGGLQSTGYYYLDAGVDLGDVFTSRVSGSLDLTGVNLELNLYDFASLYDSDNLYGASEDEFSAGIEIRYTADDPTAAPVWSEWTGLIVGDYSARAFQGRVKFSSLGGGVTPLLAGVTLVIDMPDRVYTFYADVASIGSRVEFAPAFFAFLDQKGLGLSVIDGQEGDRYSITNLDATGFDISFTNSGSPVERSISGIAQSYGEVVV